MKRLILTLALLVVFAVPVTAQVHSLMPVVVEADRIRIGAEFVPRYLDAPRVLKVAPSDMPQTLPANSSWDYIEVAKGGTLRCDPTRNTLVVFTLLTNLGTVECGTDAAPIAANVKVDFAVHDVVIDTARDPFRWGNGFLNFGKRSMVGAAKLPWTQLTVEPATGVNTITLAEDPAGWAVGDELLVPDTAYHPFPQYPRREARVTVVSLSGRVVTLSKPLDFAHLAQREPGPDGLPTGPIATMPRVANLTRNIVVRSENPSGVRGHTADIGHDATWTARYVEFSDLGRTTIATLSSTPADVSHLGTNQVGRYAIHHHHAIGFGSTDYGLVLRGSGLIPSSGKWGLVVHGTHDARIEFTIVIDFPGSGFVTEDGYEVRNVFKKNFAAYNIGAVPDALSNQATLNASSPLTVPGGQNAPGVEGAGFWVRGVRNTFEANEAWNNTVGFDFFSTVHLVLDVKYPSVPGGELDTVFDQVSAFEMQPISFDKNVTNANMAQGLELWGNKSVPIKNHVSVYNGSAAAFQGTAHFAMGVYINPLFVGSGGQGIGIMQGLAYTQSLDVTGGRILGFDYGLKGAGGGFSTNFTDTVLSNKTDLDYSIFGSPQSTSHTNVVHLPFGSYPPRYIDFSQGRVWDGIAALPSAAQQVFVEQRGSRHFITNYQGTNKNYQIMHRQQLSTTPAWPSDEWYTYLCPEAGITMGTCWDRYGIGYAGDMLQQADAKTLPGLVFTNADTGETGPGVVREGLVTAFGPPRAVMTFPSARRPADIQISDTGPRIPLYILRTGDPAASRRAEFSVDGGPPEEVAEGGVGPDATVVFTRAVSEGLHEVKTWRLTANGARIPGAESVGTYVVGAQADLCPNLAGVQLTIPAGLTLQNGACLPPPPPPVDMCPNIDGPQTTLPAGFELVNGACVAVLPDVCPNIAGTQTSVPTGMVLVNGACVVPPPPPVDLCPNIAGGQTTIPAGMTLVNGQCVATPPPPSAGTSPDPTRGPRIVDTQGRVWTFDTPNGGLTLRDGIHVGGGQGSTYAWCGGSLFVFGQDFKWYAWINEAWALRGTDDPCGAPPPPSVDVCPNLTGVQTSVPTGMVLVNGQCIATPPPPPVGELHPLPGFVHQLLINGVLQERFFFCPTTTATLAACKEFVFKP